MSIAACLKIQRMAIMNLTNGPCSPKLIPLKWPLAVSSRIGAYHWSGSTDAFACCIKAAQLTSKNFNLVYVEGWGLKGIS